MSRTDHSKTIRHYGKRRGPEKRQRAAFARAVVSGDYDALPSRLPSRAMRTSIDV